jgi:ankyrin repeat protein
MARLISSKAVYQCHNRRNELVSICICASKINQRENPDGEDIWNWYNKNDAEGIRKSIIQGADPNFCGPVIIQKSLLHRTAECGKVEIAKVLLENGANPNMKDLVN